MKALIILFTSLIGSIVLGQDPEISYKITPHPIKYDQSVTITVDRSSIPSEWNAMPDLYFWAWAKDDNGTDLGNSLLNGADWNNPANQLTWVEGGGADGQGAFTTTFTVSELFPDLDPQSVAYVNFIFKEQNNGTQSAENIEYNARPMEYTVAPDPIVSNQPVTITIPSGAVPASWGVNPDIYLWTWVKGDSDQNCNDCSQFISEQGLIVAPQMTNNGDGSYSITFTPSEFYPTNDISEIGLLFTTNFIPSGLRTLAQTSDMSESVTNLATEDIKIFSQKDLQVIQNPVKNGVLQLRYANAKGGVLYLYDTAGKLIKTFKTSADSGDETFNLSGLPAGSYLLQLKSDKGNAVSKVLVK
ncbi:MAG: T9SS type A sorting domain-containing protein [Flavobacteriaceae bacterium]|jgi:hypothetical protein|nr:T9SS type A sorting domain-containing protein [Flavobacteriaceae bacterium]